MGLLTTNARLTTLCIHAGQEIVSLRTRRLNEHMFDTTRVRKHRTYVRVSRNMITYHYA